MLAPPLWRGARSWQPLSLPAQPTSITDAHSSACPLVLFLLQVEGPPGQPKTVYNSSKHQSFTVKATDVGNLTSAQIRIVS